MGSVLETAVFAELAKRYGKEAVYFWRIRSCRKNEKKKLIFVLYLTHIDIWIRLIPWRKK